MQRQATGYSIAFDLSSRNLASVLLQRSSKVPNRKLHTQHATRALMNFVGNPMLLGTGVVVLSAVTAVVINAKRRSRIPELWMQQTAFNRAVLSRCPTINSVYEFIPFLTNG